MLDTTPFFGGNQYVVHGGHFLPSVACEISDAIYEKYNNLRLTWIPPENRDGEDNRHFAIFDELHNTIVARFTEEQLNFNHIMQFLDDNDGQKHNDLLERFEKARAKAESDRTKAIEEKTEEKLEFVHAMATSKLHTFKHNGVKFGEDRPTLEGMFDAN